MELKFGELGDWDTIPEGCRRLWNWEVLKEYPNNPKLKNHMVENWIIVETDEGLRAAGLGYGTGDFHINGDYGISYQGRSRGVFTKIDNDKD